MASVINLLASDDEDDLPTSSGLRYNPSTTTTARPAASTTATPTVAATRTASALSTVTPATKTTAPPKKKQKTSTKAYAVLWVCTHGKGRSNTWRKKDLQVMGVYSSKVAAEEAKKQIMSRHDCYGHGDICVGGTWEDEIDLVIREAPLHLEET
ncbi:hypothetical protein FisN_14Lh342 [Fistulifera solaris]|uniref:Uncharacterized protein n=1 Tax=Fistulifera solaris TaxID=1519565 RepID=A0A1Z5JI85_FISSO|nr:hypothetical protein FisN_14Lh342 [Fistulifera solaris]|eukprot:GAX13646.1 hypothetical protein FisN_14Lh342 [Fistulifera solaris]